MVFIYWAMNCCSHSTWLFLFCGILLLAVTYHHHFLPILSKNKKIIIFHYNETSPVNLHTFWEFNVMSDFVVLTCFTDVQQGEAQTQRGSRKGKKWIAGTVCCVLHACLWRPILHMESCSASLAAKLQNPFMLNSPYIHFPIWVVFPSETAISLTQNPTSI